MKGAISDMDGTPYRLYLITFERESDFVTVHHYITRKRYCQVITQPFLTELTCQLSGITTQ